jgi:beta-lactam-binding protein with PASTA domain
VIVPDLVGQSTRVATMTLGQVQMQPGKIMYVASPGAQPDEVIAQFPLPGTTVTDIRTVNLLANSTAPPPDEVYVMPDLIGRPAWQVTDFLRSYGFRVGSQQPIDYPGIAPGTIVKQAPPAGYRITQDNIISLYVSQ